MLVIDGACLVHSTTPKNQTFREYAQDFVGKVQLYARRYKRTDILFDTYKEGSIKSHTRMNRGTGSRRRVSQDGRVPKNWPNFLQNEDNKKELYPFLADAIPESIADSIIYASKDDHSLTNDKDNLTNLDSLNSNHEEPDTKMFVHLHHGIKHAKVKKAAILANDIDIIVIGIGLFENLSKDGLEELWICLGKREKRRWLPIHRIFLAFGPQKSKGILFFHAFSGCDSCSGMKGKGKKSFFSTWSVYPEVTPTFAKLSQCPQELSTDDFSILQQFIVYLYDKNSNTDNVDTARMTLFTQKIKNTIIYHQLKMLLKCMPSVQPIRLGLSGGKLSSNAQNYHLQVTGDGNLDIRVLGRFCGQRKSP